MKPPPGCGWGGVVLAFSHPQPIGGSIHRQDSLYCWSPPAYTIKTFSCGLPETGKGALSPTPYSCLVKANRYAQSTRGTPFDRLTLVANGADTELDRTVTTWKRVLGRPLLPRHCTNSRLKHNPGLSAKRTIYLAWNFSLKERCQIAHIPSV